MFRAQKLSQFKSRLNTNVAKQIIIHLDIWLHMNYRYFKYDKMFINELCN